MRGGHHLVHMGEALQSIDGLYVLKVKDFDIIVFYDSENIDFDTINMNNNYIKKMFPNVNYIEKKWPESINYSKIPTPSYFYKWLCMEYMIHNTDYDNIAYFDCDVIFLDDVSVMFDKYKEVFYGLYEGTSELMGKLIGTKNAMCSGQFFFKRELLLDIPIFFQKIMEKSKHLCDTINTTLDNHKDIPWIKTLMEQYAGHRVLMEYNILINPMHTSDIKFGSTTCDIEVLENDEIKIINSTTKIIHYTNNNAFIFVPKKYRNEDLNLLFKNNIVNKQLNRPLWG